MKTQQIRREDVRRFLGFVGYYRRFIKNFSQISRPLTDLMPIPTGKKNKGKKKERREWYWGEDQMNALRMNISSVLVSNWHVVFNPLLDASC
jgi:hypothetical protein